jgi:hypothetical protein
MPGEERTVTRFWLAVNGIPAAPGIHPASRVPITRAIGHVPTSTTSAVSSLLRHRAELTRRAKMKRSYSTELIGSIFIAGQEALLEILADSKRDRTRERVHKEAGSRGTQLE